MLWSCIQEVCRPPFQSARRSPRTVGASNDGAAGVSKALASCTSSRDQVLSKQAFADQCSDNCPSSSGTTTPTTAVSESSATISHCSSVPNMSFATLDTTEHRHGSTSLRLDKDLVRFPHLLPAQGARPKMGASLRIRVCSWNLRGHDIAAGDDITWWLRKGGATDVLVVGVRELSEWRPSAAIGISNENKRQEQLESRIERVIAGSTNKQFVKLCCTGTTALATLVYVRADLAPHVQELDCHTVKTGFGGFCGNQGGVQVRFRIGDLSASFVNVHLPSPQFAIRKRNRHLAKILSGRVSSTGSREAPWAAFSSTSASPAALPNFSVVFGDLNSSLEVDKGDDGCLPVSWEAWLWRDELLRGQYSCLDGFEEGAISFPPTNQYLPRSDKLASRQRPAWCNRVLFSSTRGAKAELLEYGSFDELKLTSDRRPVAAQFEVPSVF